MTPAPNDTNDRDCPEDGAMAHSRGSFFGRRKGHKLRSHQADLIDNLLPHLSIDISAPAPAALTELFDDGIENVRLEIGFGGGEHLIAEAQAFPNMGFIGCEPYVNGMAKILTQIEAQNIGNIRLFAGDAAELLAWAPPRSLTRIDLIHPDPWPRRRHWKRRFVQDATVAAMTRLLPPSTPSRRACRPFSPCRRAATRSSTNRSPRMAWCNTPASAPRPPTGRMPA